MSDTRKVVINIRHGGFDVSWAAAQRIAERKGLVASYFSLSPDTHRKVYGDAPVEPDNTFTHRMIGPVAITKYPDERDERFMSTSDLLRDDVDLVAVVEELGDAASGPLSQLQVVEIPANVEWVIEEYDGSEWIAETHRTWR